MTRINSDGSSIISSTLMGGSENEATRGVSIHAISDNELLVAGNSFSKDFVYGQNQTLQSNYNYTFGGASHGFIINYNLVTEYVNWATTLPVISEPYLDYDQDGLTNQEEYNLCLKQLLNVPTQSIQIPMVMGFLMAMR